MPNGSFSSVVPRLTSQISLRAVQVERGERSPGRRVAGRAERRCDQLADHSVRRAGSAGVTSLSGLLAFAAAKSARGTRRHERAARCEVLTYTTPPGIDRHAAPVDAAAGERKDERSLGRGRRVEAFVAQRGDAFAAGVTVEEGEAERILRSAAARARAAAGRAGTVCVGDELLAGRAALRHGPLLDREDGLRRCRDRARRPVPAWSPGRRRRAAAIDHERRQRRLGGDVVVPDVVLDDLECPGERAVAGMQRDHRVAVADWRRAARRRRSRGSGSRSAGTPAGALHRPTSAPRRCAAPARAPHARRSSGSQCQRGAPLLASKARTRPEGAFAALVVADRRADDDDIADDDRRRRDLQLAGPIELTDVEAHLRRPGRSRRTLAGARIERDQARVDGGGEDAQPAHRVGRSSADRATARHRGS